MKTLIVYATNSGTTEKCAKILDKGLDNTTVINILDPNPDLSHYDLIIIGSNIKFGKINKNIKQFIYENYKTLKSKRTAYFISCGFIKNAEEHFKNNFPQELLDSSITYDTFGGELDLSKLQGFDKFIAKLVSKTEDGQQEIKILKSSIDKFIKEVNKK